FFACTGVTDGDLLQGVRYEGPRGATTESLVTRSRSGTVRRISARHDREKLRSLIGDLRLGYLGGDQLGQPLGLIERHERVLVRDPDQRRVRHVALHPL